jgi:carboxypeptidase Taq
MQKSFIALLALLFTSVHAFVSSRGMLRTAPLAASFRLALSSKSQLSKSASTSMFSRATSDVTSLAYGTLTSKLKIITQLHRAKAVLEYDQWVFMPQAEATSRERGAQLSALAELIHEKETDPQLLELIARAEEEQLFLPGSDNKRLLDLTKRDFEQNARVSPELAGKVACLKVEAYSKWMEARTKDDFQIFAPTLKECFETAKQVADAKSDGKVSTYTHMLDEFEMGMAQQRIDEIFAEIESALVPLIQKVLQSDYQPSKAPLEGTFPLDAQRKVGDEIVKSIGFNTELGRVDVSAHPFTTSFSPSDVRITSRFKGSEWYQGLAGLVHEAGHGTSF